MNLNTAKALAWDAWAQVMDNRAFRVLCLLVALPILLTFLVGFREDEIVLLFGWKRYEYDELLVFMDQSIPLGADVRIQIIQSLQMIIGTYVAGSIGILISIAATAFFVPRMTEKGSADTIFSKPVSRLALLMTRYAAGLLFVALLGLGLNGGMALGLWLVSDYGDLTALWSAVTLTYTFALIYPVSILAGVETRNTVAAMLITMCFFLGNGCVHGGWELKEQGLARAAEAELETDDVLNEEQDELIGVLILALDTLHYSLPKTGDSVRLTKMLRKSFEATPLTFEDPVSEMGILEFPEGFRSVAVETVEPEDGDTETWVHLFAAVDEDGSELTFDRRRRLNTRDDGGRRRRESVTQVTDNRFLERVEALGSDAVSQASRDAMGRRPTGFVTWTELAPDGSETLHEEAYGIVRLSEDDWVVRLALTTPDATAAAAEGERITASASSDRYEATLDQLGPTKLRRRDGESTDWLGERFTWDAVWKYNPWFSIATSLGFAAAVLGLAWWRLTRVDF